MSEAEGKLLAFKVVRFTPERVKAETQVATLSMAPSEAENASLLTKAGRLRRELATWAKGGLKLVSRGVRLARLATCEACELYDPAGNAGMGECKAKGCGCTRLKAALATSKCPLKKWAE